MALCRPRPWARRVTVRAGPQVPERRRRVGVAVRVSCLSGLYGSEMGTTDTVSPPRVGCPEGGAPGRYQQASGSTHVPAFLRDTCSRTATTFERCRSCSVTLTSARRWCTHTCSIEERWGCVAPSISSERIALGLAARTGGECTARPVRSNCEIVDTRWVDCCGIETPDGCFAATACVQRRARGQPCSASRPRYRC